jgi:hypothetical protein
MRDQRARIKASKPTTSRSPHIYPGGNRQLSIAQRVGLMKELLIGTGIAISAEKIGVHRITVSKLLSDLGEGCRKLCERFFSTDNYRVARTWVQCIADQDMADKTYETREARAWIKYTWEALSADTSGRPMTMEEVVTVALAEVGIQTPEQRRAKDNEHDVPIR